MKRHLFLIIGKLTLAAGIFYAMPAGYLQWGPDYPSDGQEALGFLLWFAGLGFVSAVFFLVVGVVVQLLLRRQPWQTTLVFDASFFVVLACLLLYAGATATFS